MIFQAVLAIWLIVLTMRALGLGGRPWSALSIVAMLTVCTSLPWFSGQLMPDILFPAAVLALYLLIFRSDQLMRWERFTLAAVIVFAIPSHMAAAGMCVAIIMALWLLGRIKMPGLPTPRLWLATGSVAAGIALCPISKYRHNRQLRLHARRRQFSIWPADRGRDRRALPRRALSGRIATTVRL